MWTRWVGERWRVGKQVGCPPLVHRGVEGRQGCRGAEGIAPRPESLARAHPSAKQSVAVVIRPPHVGPVRMAQPVIVTAIQRYIGLILSFSVSLNGQVGQIEHLGTRKRNRTPRYAMLAAGGIASRRGGARVAPRSLAATTPEEEDRHATCLTRRRSRGYAVWRRQGGPPWRQHNQAPSGDLGTEESSGHIESVGGGDRTRSSFRRLASCTPVSVRCRPRQGSPPRQGKAQPARAASRGHRHAVVRGIGSSVLRSLAQARL